MDKKIRILFLEDDPEDIELIEHQLREENLEFHSRHVKTEGVFLKELIDFTPDLILADYKLSGFDGITALFLAKQKAPSIPFIFVTGSLSEETAVECMKAGAADYVIKQRLFRLGAVVNKALEASRAREEKERAEEALRASEAQYRILFENNPQPMWIFDSDTFSFIAVNDASVAQYGYSREEFLSMKINDIRLGEYEFASSDRTQNIITGRNILSGKFRKKDGTSIDAEITSHSLIFEGKHARLVLANDVTARNQAEEALRESEERYRIVAETANDAIITIDEQSTILFINAAAEKIFGYAVQEMLGQKLTMLMPESLRPAHSAGLKHYIDTNEMGMSWKGAELTGLHKSGQVIPLEISFGQFAKNGRRIFSGIVRDVTERKRAEEALASEKERLAVTLRSIADGVISSDAEGRVLLINDIAEKLTGWTQEEALGKHMSEVFQVFDENTRELCCDSFGKILEPGDVLMPAHNSLLISKDGREMVITDSVAPIRDKAGGIVGAVVVFRDITEKRKMEEEMVKSSKLETVGLLAGGIAHDFNNILTAIIGNIQLAKKSADPQSRVYQRLADIEKASLRAKGLTHQLLTFSKGGAPIMKTSSIAQFLEESARFTLRGSNIECRFCISSDLSTADIDEGQMVQVINNLIINAKQAMPEGGILEIRAENVEIGQSDSLPLPEGKRFIKISVQDHGIGIPREHLSRIFDPFFTTKKNGSGLGLATSYSIIRKHEGFITAESETGIGTIFYIYLPASQNGILQSEAVQERSAHIKRKILLMDDDEIIREMVREILSDLGCSVSLAKDGAEAIELYKRAKESEYPIDAVILDLTIPGGMGGKETVEKLLEIDPTVKAIVSSGYFNDPIMADYRRYGFSGVIVKPYTIDELKRVLQDLATAI